LINFYEVHPLSNIYNNIAIFVCPQTIQDQIGMVVKLQAICCLLPCQESRTVRERLLQHIVMQKERLLWHDMNREAVVEKLL